MSQSKKKRTDRPPGDAIALEVKADAMRSWWLPLLLALGGIAVYANSFDGAFLFDNELHIVNNEGIRTWFPPWHLLARRRPVVELSLAINYACGALRPWGYHLFNVAVHLLAGLTLFGVLRRTLSLERCPRRVRESASFLAFCCALLWLVHPLQTQSVTYVIQRGESLMGLFYLLTIYGVLRGATATDGRRWYALAVVASALGMGSKAVMVTAPIMVWVFDWCLLSGGPIQALRRRRWLYLALAGTWLLLVPLGIVRGVLDPNRTPGAVGFSNPSVAWSDYLLTQPSVLLRYIQLSFWPVGQCLDYGNYGWLAAKELGWTALFGLIVIALLAVTVVALGKRNALGVVGAWFFVVLAPTSSFIPIQDPIYEHRMYLPLASIVVLFVLGLDALLDERTASGVCADRKRRRVLTVIVMFLAVALGTTSAIRNRLYADGLRMWEDVVAKRPENARARYNLGLELQRAGRKDEAYREYERAVELSPTFALPYNNLALARLEQGRVDEAVAYFRRGIALKPVFPEAMTNLGLALLRKGDHEEARDMLTRAVEFDPRRGSAYFGLGRAYGELGDFEHAVASLRQAVHYLPDRAEPYVWLGKSLAMLGRFDEATATLETAVKLDPHDATAVELLRRVRAQASPGR